MTPKTTSSNTERPPSAFEAAETIPPPSAFETANTLPPASVDESDIEEVSVEAARSDAKKMEELESFFSGIREQNKRNPESDRRLLAATAEIGNDPDSEANARLYEIRPQEDGPSTEE